MRLRFFALLLLLLGFAFGSDGEILVDFKGSDLVIMHEDYDDEVMINDDYHLFVNDKEVVLTDESSELIKRCYLRVETIKDEAEKIEDEGINIGIKGGALGVSAVAGVFKMILPGYDSEDFERDIEREAEKIERQAERIERRADTLESEINKFTNDFDKLTEMTLQLKKLRWL